MLDTALADATAIATYAAEVLRLWPPLQKKVTTTTARRRVGAPKRQVPAEAQHEWRFFEGAWRCTRCLSCAVGAASDPSGTRGRCSGRGTDARAEEAADRGHSVAIAEGGGMPVVFCLKCGAWTARRQRGTARPCRGAPTPAGRQALYNIARGRHPWLPPGVRDAQRAALHSCAAAAVAKRRRVDVDEQSSRRDPGPLAETIDTDRVPQMECDVFFDDGDADDHGAVAQEDWPPEEWDPVPRPTDEDEDVFGHGGSLDETPHADDSSAAMRTARGSKRDRPQSLSPPPQTRRRADRSEGPRHADEEMKDPTVAAGDARVADAEPQDGGRVKPAAGGHEHRVHREVEGSHDAALRARLWPDAPAVQPRAAERSVPARGKRTRDQGRGSSAVVEFCRRGSGRDELGFELNPTGPSPLSPPNALRRRAARGDGPLPGGGDPEAASAPTAAERLAARRRRIQQRPLAASPTSPRPSLQGEAAVGTPTSGAALRATPPQLQHAASAVGSSLFEAAGIRGRGGNSTLGHPLGIGTAAAACPVDDVSVAPQRCTPVADHGIRGRSSTPGPAGGIRDRRQLIERLRSSCGAIVGRDGVSAISSGATIPSPRSPPAHRDGEGGAARDRGGSTAGPAPRSPVYSARAELLRQLGLSRS